MAAIENPQPLRIADNTLHCIDALELCANLEGRSVNLIFADLPYGVTANAWDIKIPLGPLWQEFKRILSPGGCVLLSATQPFASELVTSAPRGWFRFDWVWIKPNARNWLNAKVRPMIVNESVLVFSPSAAPYYPIMLKR